MFMDRERRLSARNGSMRTPPEYTNGKFRDDNNGYGGGFLDRSEKSPSRSNILRILLSPTSSPPPPPSGSSPERGYIEHRVSKFDTLAGIAIKYGVEVADVKKMNGLVTDLQMFALKSLQIPLPGRHPPSPCLSNGSLNHGSKASSRTSLSSAESETTSNFNPVPINLMDAPVSDTFSSVRKSSSASSLQDPDGSNGSSSLSLWPTSKWRLKPDLLTPAAITSSIFDGLPKPLTGRRNKAAMD
ncbi:hypothetical protein HID58_050354 [Brassica napus]|uniref:LysM domain-containing protein n=1 Tax=Brassica napus TaxID=3708 RepID=A0ABQ8A5X2_BRANA|nr:hypothetical protein HID58_050354 [Brassica napus]